MTGTAQRRALIDIPGWETHWIYLAPGPLSHTAVRLTLDSGIVVALQTSAAGILRGLTATGSVALLASLSATASLRSQAQPVGGDSGLLLGSAASFDLYLPDGGGMVIFSVPASGAATAGGRCRLDTTQTSLLARCVDSLQQQLRGAAGESQRRASDSRRRLRGLLRSTTESLFGGAGPQLLAERARLLRHLAVMRACDFIATHLHAPISLADLCAAASVGTRALEYGFRDFYELGPMAYVRNLRLCRVRDELLDCARHGGSVSNTARRWCFTHMGQFSHDYRELFGEMPSMTLARPGRECEPYRGAVPRG